MNADADLGTVDLEVDGETFAIVAYRLDGVTHVEFQSGPAPDPRVLYAVEKPLTKFIPRRPR